MPSLTGPDAPPFINMVQWLVRPLPMLDRLAARYGTRFSMRLPGIRQSMMFFSEPDAVREIWHADADTLHAGEANEILRPILGDHSLLLLDGDRHLRERRLLLPPFHGDRMRAYGDVMRESTERAIAAWPTGQTFPVMPTMQAITLDVIMRAILGADSPALRETLVRWASLGTSPIGNAMLMLVPPQHMGRLLAVAEQQPWGRFLPWASLSRAHIDIDRRLRELLVERRRAGTAGRTDVLAMLLDARDEGGHPMTDDELRDEMLTLLVAGHETTATTLAWVLHHLVENPAWLARVVDEVRAGGTELLDATIKETLRLTPIIPMVARVVTRETTIGGTRMPAGSVAAAVIYLVHRRPDLWPDPTRFDPSRFVGTKPDPAHYFPFGGGTRRCLGMAFASYEMRIVLATILSRFDVVSAGKRVRVVRRGVTLAPSGGMQIRATRT